MLRLERLERSFRMAAGAFLASLTTLTGIIWITGALKEISLLTSKGQTLLVFFAITGLGLPFLLASIAPIALFGSVLYCLNRLNSDSELIVHERGRGIARARCCGRSWRWRRWFSPVCWRCTRS